MAVYWVECLDCGEHYIVDPSDDQSIMCSLEQVPKLIAAHEAGAEMCTLFSA